MKVSLKSAESKRTMIHLLNLAMRKDISWPTLASLIVDIASTLVKSKTVISILLKEFETFNNKSKNYQPEKNTSETGMFEDSFILSQSESQAANAIEEIPEGNKREMKELEPETEYSMS